MAKEALIIIDMLNDFVRKGAPLEVSDTRRAIPAIKREISRFRRKGDPVIYLCDAHNRRDREFSRFGWPPHAVSGTEGSEVVRELRPAANDIVVKKKTYSAFYRTTLLRVLKESGVKSVRITGCVTHICVLFTAYEAVVQGYEVSVVEKGIAGISKKDHDAALRIMRNVLGVKII